MFEAIVFDMDGVIVDTEKVWERVRRRYVAERGGRWPEDAQRRLMGTSTPEWAAIMAAEFGLRAPAGTIADEVVGLMAREFTERLPEIAGAVETVRRLAARWPVAIASSSPPVLIETMLRRTGLAAAVTAWVSSDQVGPGKPAPDVYLEAARRLGADPTACLAVEDSTNGLRSALAAGMRVVAVPRPEYPPEPGVVARAVRVLDDLAELTPRLVESLYPSGPVVGAAPGSGAAPGGGRGRPVLYAVVCGAAPAVDVARLVACAGERGWEVWVIATKAAVEYFFDPDEVARLTGHPVRTGYRRLDEPGDLPRADAAVVAPATYNTINKWAAGIADSFPLSTLAELTGARVPIAVLPFVSSALAATAAFDRSVAALRAEGVRVLLGPGGFEPHPAHDWRERAESYPWPLAIDALGDVLPERP